MQLNLPLQMSVEQQQFYHCRKMCEQTTHITIGLFSDLSTVLSGLCSNDCPNKTTVSISGSAVLGMGWHPKSVQSLDLLKGTVWKGTFFAPTASKLLIIMTIQDTSARVEANFFNSIVCSSSLFYFF